MSVGPRLEDEMVALFSDMIYRETGVLIEASKKILMEGRLRPEVNSLGLGSFAEYFSALKKAPPHSELRRRFIDVVTTHETSFFRTIPLWEYLEKEWEGISLKGEMKPFRVWSAACATGEEPTTIAMLCSHIQLRHGRFPFEIHASDISDGSVLRARSGLFGPNSVREMGPYRSLFNGMTEQRGADFQVSPTVVRQIQYRVHNLFESPFGTSFDIVFLRNVLMYFTQEDQRKVLQNIIRASRPDGMVIVGETESLKGVLEQLQYVRPGVYRVNKDRIGASRDCA